MPGSSLGTRASSMRPPPGARTSGTAFESPPAPTSWIIRTGFAFAQGPAGVDDLLRAPLHLGIAALHRGEIERFAAGAAALRGSRAAAQADQHRRPAEQHDRRPCGHGQLLDVRAAHVADPAGDHDRLVVAAHDGLAIAGDALLEAPEVPEDAGAPELVVERRRTDRDPRA